MVCSSRYSQVGYLVAVRCHFLVINHPIVLDLVSGGKVLWDMPVPSSKTEEVTGILLYIGLNLVIASVCW